MGDSAKDLKEGMKARDRKMEARLIMITMMTILMMMTATTMIWVEMVWIAVPCHF